MAQDVTDRVGPDIAGRIFLIPSSMEPGEITRVLREGYDAQRLTGGLRDLVGVLDLDFLLIDTHPGLNEETLLSLVISSALIIVMRPDRQDYEGTGITVRVARELDVPDVLLVVNKTPLELDPRAVAQRVAATYECEVVAVLPHSDELMSLASEGVFAIRYPDHPVTAHYRTIADRVRRGGRWRLRDGRCSPGTSSWEDCRPGAPARSSTRSRAARPSRSRGRARRWRPT